MIPYREERNWWKIIMIVVTILLLLGGAYYFGYPKIEEHYYKKFSPFGYANCTVNILSQLQTQGFVKINFEDGTSIVLAPVKQEP